MNINFKSNLDNYLLLFDAHHCVGSVIWDYPCKAIRHHFSAPFIFIIISIDIGTIVFLRKFSSLVHWFWLAIVKMEFYLKTINSGIWTLQTLFRVVQFIQLWVEETKDRKAHVKTDIKRFRNISPPFTIYYGYGYVMLCTYTTSKLLCVYLYRMNVCVSDASLSQLNILAI